MVIKSFVENLLSGWNIFGAEVIFSRQKHTRKNRHYCIKPVFGLNESNKPKLSWYFAGSEVQLITVTIHLDGNRRTGTGRSGVIAKIEGKMSGGRINYGISSEFQAHQHGNG